MIVSHVKQLGLQATLPARLKTGIEFLQRSDIRDLADGRVEIDGDRVFAIVQRYETTPAAEPAFEYHRKYIDIQFIVAGEEVIGWVPSQRIEVTEAYDVDKDIAFGRAPQGQWTPLLLQAGHAAVLYPEDGHAPKLAAGKPSPVHKIVVKVAV